MPDAPKTVTVRALPAVTDAPQIAVLAEQVAKLQRDLANLQLHAHAQGKALAIQRTQIAEASEQARQARQSSSELESEFRQSFGAAARELAETTRDWKKEQGVTLMQMSEMRTNIAALTRETKGQTTTLEQQNNTLSEIASAVKRGSSHPLARRVGFALGFLGAAIAASYASYAGAQRAHSSHDEAHEVR